VIVLQHRDEFRQQEGLAGAGVTSKNEGTFVIDYGSENVVNGV
jgi:hypothetical protein